MTHLEDEWLEHQRSRWMRPDAHRFIRPDWRRYVKPESELCSVFELYERKYSPDQPRVPAGNPDGGQWTSGSGEGETTELSAASRNKARGHHELPQSLYNKLNLSPETRKVFEDATTGPINARGIIEGKLRGHFWDGPRGAHGVYNEAVEELRDRFMAEIGIKPEQMTPEQARLLIERIKQSQDPRIRDYNNIIRLLQRLFRTRTGGRGNE
jgi:hypothetical protein